jgi:NADH-quinone oxidoreductase subunit K
MAMGIDPGNRRRVLAGDRPRVMAGLGPAIHDFLAGPAVKSWMAGPRPAIDTGAVAGHVSGRLPSSRAPPHHHPGPRPMNPIGTGHYLTVSAILLVLGTFGIFLNRKNVIIIMMSIELILLAVNLNLVAFSAALDDLAGQVLAMLVLTVAAAESAIGLAIITIYFRNRGSIQVEDITMMKG